MFENTGLDPLIQVLSGILVGAVLDDSDDVLAVSFQILLPHLLGNLVIGLGHHIAQVGDLLRTVTVSAKRKYFSHGSMI